MSDQLSEKLSSSDQVRRREVLAELRRKSRLRQAAVRRMQALRVQTITRTS